MHEDLYAWWIKIWWLRYICSIWYLDIRISNLFFHWMLPKNLWKYARMKDSYPCVGSCSYAAVMHMASYIGQRCFKDQWGMCVYTNEQFTIQLSFEVELFTFHCFAWLILFHCSCTFIHGHFICTNHICKYEWVKCTNWFFCMIILFYSTVLPDWYCCIVCILLSTLYVPIT